jgi:hypothetical protein
MSNRTFGVDGQIALVGQRELEVRALSGAIFDSQILDRDPGVRVERELFGSGLLATVVYARAGRVLLGISRQGPIDSEWLLVPGISGCPLAPRASLRDYRHRCLLPTCPRGEMYVAGVVDLDLETDGVVFE